uniref:hypothetical protein n=1 Tax=Eisenbergiella sp. TaxID=1924109 RepID=UPI003FEE78A2
SISGLFVDVKHFLNFFRSSRYSRLPQQIDILSAFFCSVNSFLKPFLPDVNVRLLSTDSPAGMEAASGKLRMKWNNTEKRPQKAGLLPASCRRFLL